jgi:hypothetical protein
MILKLVLDRYEEDLGVCLDFENKRHYIPKDILGDIKVNDIFNIEFDGENYHSPSLLAKETEETAERISEKMRKLYNMSRHRRPPKL